MADQPALPEVPYSKLYVPGGDADHRAFEEFDKAGYKIMRFVVGRAGAENHLQDEVKAIIPLGAATPVDPPISTTTGVPIKGFEFFEYPCQVVVQTKCMIIKALPDSQVGNYQAAYDAAWLRYVRTFDPSALAQMSAAQQQAAALSPPVVLFPSAAVISTYNNSVGGGGAK